VRAHISLRRRRTAAATVAASRAVEHAQHVRTCMRIDAAVVLCVALVNSARVLARLKRVKMAVQLYFQSPAPRRSGRQTRSAQRSRQTSRTRWLPSVTEPSSTGSTALRKARCAKRAAQGTAGKRTHRPQPRSAFAFAQLR
jgi:hypothetical protein